MSDLMLNGLHEKKYQAFLNRELFVFIIAAFLISASPLSAHDYLAYKPPVSPNGTAPAAAQKSGGGSSKNASSFSPALPLKAEFNTTRARVGEIVQLTLSYTLPPGAKMPDKHEIAGLETLNIIDQQGGPGYIRLSILVDALDAIKINALTLNYLDADGSLALMQSAPLSLEISSNMEQEPDKIQLKPIADIIPAYPFWLIPMLWALGVVLIVLAIAGGIWWYRRRRRLLKSMVQSVPPHLRARTALETLDTSGVFERGQVKEYYFRFSEILKHYLAEIRGFPAAEFTTEEISTQITREIDWELVSLLKYADLVKFADDVPSAASKESHIRAALAYIATTAPQPEQTVAPPPPAALRSSSENSSGSRHAGQSMPDEGGEHV